MPTLAVLAIDITCLAVIVGAVRYLRDTQPDPNPAIEAREAAKAAAALAAGLPAQG